MKQKQFKKIKLNQELNWFKLDNAALIYPAVSTNKWNAVYRVSAVLKDVVNPDVLNQALHDVIVRFPHFNVSLNRGIFWFYFQEIKKLPNVIKDDNYPCRKMDFKRNSHLFRVLYYNKKISFEAFHSLTDGYGAIVFLNTLLSRYFSLLGIKITKDDSILNYLDKPREEELEDSFYHYADLKTRNPWSENKAYQISGTNEEAGKLNVINGIMNSKLVKEKAKEYNCTVTEFLLAVLFMSVIKYKQTQKSAKRPVRISLPINLRNIFQSKSLRNFSSYMNIELKANNANNLEEIIGKIQEHTHSIDKGYVMGNMNANVKAQNNILLRLTPLFIKNLVLKLVFSIVGERIFTMTLSNVGKISTPKEFEEIVERYEINLGSGKLNKMGATVITFNNELVITFSSTIKETQIERDFFRILTEMGISIKVESNL